MHGIGLQPLPVGASADSKQQHYAALLQDIQAVLKDEPDWVTAMATCSSMLHAAFQYFSWTGFYRRAQPPTPDQQQTVQQQDQTQQKQPGELVIGPYQGSLGCLRIAFSRGVCGAAARTREAQLVADVHAFPGHIACASSTQSEVVVPILRPYDGAVVAVLDVDSDQAAAFDDMDVQGLQALCSWLASAYFGSSR